ncbi:MAG TPA: universal stress protein [Candidatus Sulfotelmatobacter sp.]|nr:universal stress protein [Candidatus Sulfotelmatobacter sp.]
MKILLAVDHSTYSQAALRALIAQIRSENTEVAVLHVMELALADFESRQTFQNTRPARLKEADQLLEGFVSELKQAGYLARAVVEEGVAKEAILNFAEHWKPDVIFLGSHGRRAFKRLTLGGVTEAVARHANCSVEIVRAPRAG